MKIFLATLFASILAASGSPFIVNFGKDVFPPMKESVKNAFLKSVDEVTVSIEKDGM